MLGIQKLNDVSQVSTVGLGVWFLRRSFTVRMFIYFMNHSNLLE